MLFFRKPPVETVHRFLIEEAKRGFSYSAVGATATTPPEGFDVDHTRVKLGDGELAFTAATAALRRWEQFRLGWIEIRPPETPIQSGKVVAILGRIAGVWWLSSCRIVYVIDAAGPIRKFGFAYGSLPGHVAKGEERFLIEWDLANNSVWYDIFVFSKPNHFLAWLGYPFFRLMQKRFREESAASILNAVHSVDVEIGLKE